jgi:glycosyltransferase involved in cell wall biosynthesis
VLAQTFQDWEQIICSDGSPEDVPHVIVKQTNDPRIQYTHTYTHKDDHAFSLRREMLDKAKGELVVFFDDDNFLCPTYLEKMRSALCSRIDDDNNPRHMLWPKFAICQIVHFGPLPQKYGTPPKVVTGLPPVLYSIDTLNCMSRKDALLSLDWNQNTGYFFESIYGQMSKKYKWVEVPEVLGIHL